MIKEYWNLIGQKAHLAKSGSLKCYLPLMNNCMQKKNLDHLILYTDTDDQSILQSDCTKDTTDHTQPKVVVSYNTFLCRLSPCKKSKRLIDSDFLRY